MEEFWKNNTDLQLEGEIWVDIEGYEGLYQISNYGRAKSLARYTSIGKYLEEKILKSYVGSYGYLITQLCKNGKRHTIRIHRLVANAFIDNPDNLPEVNHIDEDKFNNSMNNLEWCDRTYNVNYGNRSRKQSISSGSPVLAINIKTNKRYIFLSMRDCSRYLKRGHSGLIACLQGRQKTSGGYCFERINKEDFVNNPDHIQNKYNAKIMEVSDVA